MNGKNARDLRKIAVVLSTAGDIEGKVTPQETRRTYRKLKQEFKDKNSLDK